MDRKYDDQRSKKALDFLDALKSVCKEHGLCLGHEDAQGGFIVEDLDSEDDCNWMLAAADDSSDDVEMTAFSVQVNGRIITTPYADERQTTTHDIFLRFTSVDDCNAATDAAILAINSKNPKGVLQAIRNFESDRGDR